MKARRFLAFILMITIILGNTMSVSATSSSVSMNGIVDSVTEELRDEEVVVEEELVEDEDVNIEEGNPDGSEDKEFSGDDEKLPDEDATVSQNEIEDEAVIGEEETSELPLPAPLATENAGDDENTPIYGAYWGLPSVLAPTVPGSTTDEWSGDVITDFGRRTGDVFNDYGIYKTDMWKILNPEEGLLWAGGILYRDVYYESNDSAKSGIENKFKNDFSEIDKNAITEMRLLTKEEMLKPEYGFNNFELMDYTKGLTSYSYQLQCEESGTQVWVTPSGAFADSFGAHNVGQAPALVLDTDKIFLTVLDDFTYEYVKQIDYSYDNRRYWNLVFKTEDDGFAVEIPEKTVAVGGTLKVNVTALANKLGYEYDGLSLTLTDANGDLVVYERLSGNNSDTYDSATGYSAPTLGEFEFFLPEQLTPGEYTVHIFEEHADGCTTSDAETCESGYVSNVVEDTIKVEGATAVNHCLEQTYGEVEFTWEIKNKRTEDPGTVTVCDIYRSDSMDDGYVLVEEDRYCSNTSDSYFWGDSDVEVDESTGQNKIYYYKIVVADEDIDNCIAITNKDVPYRSINGGTEEYRRIYIAERVNDEYVERTSLTMRPEEYKELFLVMEKEDGTKVVDEIVSEDKNGYSSDSISWFLCSSAATGSSTSDAETKEAKDAGLEFLPMEEDVEWKLGFFDCAENFTAGRRYYLFVQRGISGIGRFWVQIPVITADAVEGETYTKTGDAVGKFFLTPEALSQAMRDDMVARKSSGTYYVSRDAYFMWGGQDEIYDFSAEREGMLPEEGDYLRWQCFDPNKVVDYREGWLTETPVYFNSKEWWKIELNQVYYTTAAQEAAVTEKIDYILTNPNGGLYSTWSKYYKEDGNYTTAERKAIADACCQYVYDNVSYIGTVTPKYHSAWSAIVNGTGTCQAYALFYTRLLREFGVATKILTGTDANYHTYNIVQIDADKDEWYYYDATGNIKYKTESQFKRTKYQDMFVDNSRFIQNYISKIVGTPYEAGIHLYGDGELIGKYFEMNYAIDAMYEDVQKEGREDTRYTIKLTQDAIMTGHYALSIAPEITYCEVDLNGYQLTLANGASFHLDCLKNGKLYQPLDALPNETCFGSPWNENSTAVYENLSFRVQYWYGEVYISSDTDTEEKRVVCRNVDITDTSVFEASGNVYVDENSQINVVTTRIFGTDNEHDLALLGKITTEELFAYGKIDVGSLIVSERAYEVGSDSFLHYYFNRDYASAVINIYDEFNIKGHLGIFTANTSAEDSTKQDMQFNLVQTIDGTNGDKVLRTGKMTVGSEGLNVNFDYAGQMGSVIFGKKVMRKTGETLEDLGYVKFDSGETIVTMKAGESLVPLSGIKMYQQEEKDIITRSGYKLIAERTTVKVSHADAETREYASLQAALSSITTDFGSDKGTYTFTFIEDAKMNASVTIPSFVQKAVFCAETENRTLDFNGYSISASTVVDIEDTLECINTSATASKWNLTSKNGSDGYVLKIAGDMSAVNVSAANGTVVLASNVEEIIHNVDSTLGAKEVIVQCGKWHLNTVSTTTFTNNASVYADTIKNITTLNNATGAVLAADTYTQKATGKTNLEADSKFVILTSGTVYNTVLGGTDSEADGLVYVYAPEDSTLAFETKVSAVNDDVKMSFGRIAGDAPEQLLTGTVEVLPIAPRTKVFSSKISAFPVDLITVNQPQDSVYRGAYEEVYQDSTNIYVGREWITISTKQINGDEELIKSFIRWSDAAAYLNTLANSPMEYVVEIAEDIEMTTALTLPSKVKGITFRGSVPAVVDESGEQVVNRVNIKYAGDLKLASNTTFENVNLIAQKYNSKTKKYDVYKSAVNVNGKELTMINTSADFTSVTGNSAKSVVNLTDCDVTVAKTVASVGMLKMDNTSLTVAQSVAVTDTLTMQSAAIDAGTFVSIKNVVTNGAGNLISYGGNGSKNSLTISGNVSSETGRDAILLRAKALEPDKYTQGTLLCNATKAGANWFAIANAEGNGASDIGIYKKGNAIYCGEVVENVKLYSSAERESGYVEESSFATLQEAFAEIDKIALSDNYYYVELVTDTKGVVTFVDKNLTFPSKAKEVIIGGGNIHMKDSMTLKCNTALEGTTLVPAKAATLSMGKYELLFKDCLIGDGSSDIGFKKITGSGVTGTSKLTLDNTSLDVTGEVSGIGTLVYADTQEEGLAVYSLLQDVNTKGVSVYPHLTADGIISVGNIELQTDGYLTGYAKVTRNSSKVVTAIASQITIAGEVTSTSGSALYLDLQEVVSKKYVALDFDNSDMTAMLDSGVKLAKAVVVTYPNVRAAQRSDKMLIKSGGYMTYFDGGYGIELAYEDENGQAITTACRTFADAVTEINNQKTKRDYAITILQESTEISGADQNGSNEVPKALSMPNKSYVGTLTIQKDMEAEGPVELGFINNITLTGNVILRDVTFVQMIKSGSAYVRADVLKDGYPAAVTLNTAGYDLTVKGTNTFNTPLILNGGTKGNITFDVDGTITTLTNDYDEVPDLDEEVIDNVIYGRITDFNTVDVDGCNLMLKEYRSSRTSDKYTASSNKMTTLNVTEYGSGTGRVTVVGQTAKGSLSVTNLNNNNGKILVDGKVNLKNVSIEGTQKPTIRADLDFNITGAFVNRSSSTILVTRLKGAGKAPYLNISGTLDRVGETGPITVCVYPESTASAAIRNIPVTLIPSGKTSAQLLTAKNAKARDFMPQEDNYAGGEYDFENTSGYMMFKSGSNIMVYDGSKVAVGVYKGQDIVETALVGFYPSVKDATSYVNSLKDKSQDYTYVLLGQNGSVSSPIPVTIPSYASSITITSLEEGTVISGISGANTQTLVLDMENATVTGTIEKVKELVIKEDTTVNSAVKVTTLCMETKQLAEEEFAPVTLKVKGTVAITDLNNVSYPGTDRNVLEFTRTSKNVTNLTINGQIINTAEKIVLKQSDDKAVKELAKSGVQALLSDAKKFAVMPKASTDSFYVNADIATSSGEIAYVSDQNDSYKVVKAAKGIYLADGTLNGDMVLLTRIVNTDNAEPEERPRYETTCLDYSQAVNEINAIADVNSDYEIILHAFKAESTQGIDTVVTDKYAYGTFTLPGSNKKNELVIKHADENRKVTVPFTGNISGYGSIIMENLEFSPVKSSSSSEAVDAKITVSADKTTNSPVLVLENVSTKTAVAETTSTKGFITSIAGSKNKTDVIIADCGNLILKTGISNVDEVVLTDTKLFTAGASTVNSIRIADIEDTQKISSWDSLGKLTVNDVYMPEGVTDSYIGTKQDKNGNPQFVLNNEVRQGKLLCKVYTKDTAITDADEIFAVATEAKFAKEPAKYSGVSLVSAKKASADRIRAYAFRDASVDGSSIVNNAEEITVDNLISYKAGAYVVNGNKANMAVQITEHESYEDGAIISSFYAESIDAAVTAINNKADTNSYYVIRFMQEGTKDNPVLIKTTKNGTAYGAFTLPSKAAGVTIRGYEATTGEGNAVCPGTVIKYTGTLKASCDVKFDNILLTEGSVIKKPVDDNDFTEKGSVTPAPAANVVMSFGKNVFTYADETKQEQVIDGNLYFASANSTKGTIALNGNRVMSAGSITLLDLILSNGAVVETTGKVTVTNLHVDANSANKVASTAAMSIGNVDKSETENSTGNVVLQSGFTKPKKATDRPVTQLTISGDITDAKVVICPQLYKADVSGYSDMTEDELMALRMESNKNPEGYRKLANVTKASLDNITVLGSGMESGFAAYDNAYEGEEAQTYLYKYASGLYLTNAEPLVKVTGYVVPEDNAEAYADTDLCYQAEFLSWDQAVKEIDKINDKTRFYEMELLNTIGTTEDVLAGVSVTSPLGTVSMPSKAAEVKITSEDGKKHGIFFTGTTLTIKCPTVMEDIGFTCVKKYGKGTAAYYAPVAYTMNIGNYRLTQQNMINVFCGMKTVPYTISGSAKGVFEILADAPGGQALATVKNINELIVNCMDAHDSGSAKFILECSGDISVKSLTVTNSTVEAKNISVNTLATLDEASLRAGTSAANDGKLTIKDIKLADNKNTLTAEQNKSGTSQITINGAVTETEDAQADALADGTITLKLYYNNYQKKFLWWVFGDIISQKPAQLYDGMILCVAPKAASDLFIPEYSVKANEEEQISAVDGMGKANPDYGTYKSGKNICYGKTIIEGAPVMEAILSIGDSGMTSYFTTLEGAVKEIDSLGLYKDPTAKTKEYEDYTITLLKDVEIGNDKKNNSFSALSLPTKAKELVIDGNANESNGNQGYSVSFNNNVTVKCNTKFADIILYPIKNVKGAGVKTPVNYSIGNYTLELNNVVSEDASGVSLFGNISGSSKSGTLKLAAGAEDRVYDVGITQLSGLREVVLEENTKLNVAKNYSVYQISFAGDGNAPILAVDGTLTTTLINSEKAGECGNVYGIIRKPVASKMTVNGVYNSKTKEYSSLSFPQNEENGRIKIEVIGSPCPSGTLVLTGKNLNWDDIKDKFTVVNRNNELSSEFACTTYSKGTNLYIEERAE